MDICGKNRDYPENEDDDSHQNEPQNTEPVEVKYSHQLDEQQKQMNQQQQDSSEESKMLEIRRQQEVRKAYQDSERQNLLQKQQQDLSS